MLIDISSINKACIIIIIIIIIIISIISINTKTTIFLVISARFKYQKP